MKGVKAELYLLKAVRGTFPCSVSQWGQWKWLELESNSECVQNTLNVCSCVCCLLKESVVFVSVWVAGWKNPTKHNDNFKWLLTGSLFSGCCSTESLHHPQEQKVLLEEALKENIIRRAPREEEPHSTSVSKDGMEAHLHSLPRFCSRPGGLKIHSHLLFFQLK